MASDVTKWRIRRAARLILLILVLGPIGFVIALMLNQRDQVPPYPREF